jgi:hypothetical protein
MHFSMYPRCTFVVSGLVRMLIHGYINKFCRQTPTDLRMGAMSLQPTLQAYLLLLLRLIVKLRLTQSFSLVVTRVNLKIGSRHNRNLSFYSE